MLGIVTSETWVIEEKGLFVLQIIPMPNLFRITEMHPTKLGRELYSQNYDDSHNMKVESL